MSYKYVFVIPDIESFRLVPHMTNIIECFKIPNFSHDPYGHGPEMALLHIGWRGKLGGVSGDLSEQGGSGITLLRITSLFMHKLTGLQCYDAKFY